MFNCVAMLFTQNSEDVFRTICDKGKHVENVATKDAHVKRFMVDTSHVFASENCVHSIISKHANRRGNDDSPSQAANSANLIFRRESRKLKVLKYRSANDRAVSSRVNEQLEASPRSAERRV